MSQTHRLPAISLLTAALLATGPACGHRGDPLPPLRHTPPGLAEFRLAQRGEALEVSLLTPAASVDGLAYEQLAVEILFVEGQKDLEKAGTRREVLAPARARVVETLPLPVPGTVARAAARGVVGREKGPRTLTMALVVQSPVAAPSELSARLAAEGVRLEWAGEAPQPVSAAVLPPRPPGAVPRPTAAGAAASALPSTATAPATTRATAPAATPATAPATAAPPASAAPPSPPQALPGAPAAGTPSDAQAKATTVEPRKAGFHVYRRVGAEGYRLPLAVEPLAERATFDLVAPQGQTACYVVRAVASVDPLVESVASNEACVEVRDIQPPAAPAGLAVLPRERGLEVLWAPSPEEDVLVYRVYREAQGQPRRLVAEVESARAAWLDTAVRPGDTYWYTLTAVDRAGNESPAAPPVEASLP